MSFEESVENIGRVVEAVGVGVIILGIGWASVCFVLQLRDGASGYAAYRRNVGCAILLGLEFLVAGDIIRTVAISPTYNSVGILAAIVAIRTFLSFSLEVELEGRWPWQPKPSPEEHSRPASVSPPGHGQV